MKQYTILDGTQQDSVFFHLGMILAKRKERGERVVFVFGSRELVPNILVPYIDVPLDTTAGVYVFVGVTGVDDTLDYLATTISRVHLIYYMPKHFSVVDIDERSDTINVEVATKSDTIRRAIMRQTISAVTIFVEQPNV